ncbi:hypothetical protein LJR164_001600 [Phenylobacterium sp. LjRoot164]|uniref:hypothetical protein n=1 Tax=unclassified Phenylobacterium TaxID=2640670 RepID=UPI003ED0845D
MRLTTAIAAGAWASAAMNIGLAFWPGLKPHDVAYASLIIALALTWVAFFWSND